METLFEDFNGFHPIAVVWVQRRRIQTQSWIMAAEFKWHLKMEFQYSSHEQASKSWKLPRYLLLYLFFLAVESLCSATIAGILYPLHHFFKWLE